MNGIKKYLMMAVALLTWLPSDVQGQDVVEKDALTHSDDTLLIGPVFKDKDELQMLYDYEFPDNWFYMLQVGTFLNWGSNQGSGDLAGRFRPSIGVSLGKWFYTTVGVRAQVYLGNNRGFTDRDKKEYHWQTAGFGVDGMLNLTNLLLSYREKRPFSFLVYIGMGGDQTFGFSKRDWNTDDSPNHFHTGPCSLLTFRTGAMASWRLNNKWDICLDLTNIWVDDSYDGIITDNRWDGHLNLMLGLIRRLGNRDKTHNFYYVRRDGSILSEANDEINRLRAEAQRVRSLPPLPPTKTQQLHTIVSFRNQLATVDELQEVNVYTAVQAMRHYENKVNLYITALRTTEGEMTTQDRQLFNQRAETVKQLLTQRYGIPADLVTVNADAREVEQKDKETGSVVIYINQSLTDNDQENEDRRLKDIQ